MSKDEIKPPPKKSEYTITADEAIRYAKEALKDEKFVALIREHMANPPQNDEESEMQQGQIHKIAHDYVESKGMHFNYASAYHTALDLHQPSYGVDVRVLTATKQ